MSERGGTSDPRAAEHGDRRAFLARARGQLAGVRPDNHVHRLAPRRPEVPRVASSLLDASDLVTSFERNAAAVRVIVHRTPAAEAPLDILADVVHRNGVRRAVVSGEPHAQATREPLVALGVTVEDLSTEVAARADLGVTGSTCAIATTGTLVLEASSAGGRSASLLPPVHLAVLRADQIVASSADVLRGLGVPGRLPSNLVLVTGPSRSADIEQIIAFGVHGPTRVEVILLGA